MYAHVCGVWKCCKFCKFASLPSVFSLFLFSVCCFRMGSFLFPSLYARANITMCLPFSSGVLRYKNMLCNTYIPRPSHLPRVFSIDEFKGNAAGQKYQVIITDSKNKRILDILPARTTPALLQYFYQFPMSKRRKVEFVTMDMSMQFCSVIKTIFPKARITADRFHMTRLVQMGHGARLQGRAKAPLSP